MPIYEFRCLACGNITEKNMSIQDSTQNILCESCQEHTAKRIISKTSFRLYGTGWYNPSSKEEG